MARSVAGQQSSAAAASSANSKPTKISTTPSSQSAKVNSSFRVVSVSAPMDLPGIPGTDTPSFSSSRRANRSLTNVMNSCGEPPQPCRTPRRIFANLETPNGVFTAALAPMYSALKKLIVNSGAPLARSLRSIATCPRVSNALRRSEKKIIVSSPIALRRIATSSRAATCATHSSLWRKPPWSSVSVPSVADLCCSSSVTARVIPFSMFSISWMAR